MASMSNAPVSPHHSPEAVTESTLDRAVHGATSVIDQVAQQAQQDADHRTGRQTSGWISNCRNSARAHPLATLGVAVGAGLLLRGLWRR